MSEDGAKKRKVSHLSGAQLMLLNDACIRVRESLGDYGTYLVGSSTERPDYRDVDVRHIMADDRFDAIFGGHQLFWSLLCMAVSVYLSQASGLPVDFQVQRMTEANEKYPDLGTHPRHPLGMRARAYAGGGDATRYDAGGPGDRT